MKPARTLLTIDRFFAQAPKMRAEFEERFADPRAASAERFIWDYWHVPGQYTALRTPAYRFFDPQVYDAFHQQLVWWGRRNLGCHDVSPTWMSCYVEGCKQEMHGDLPHGPWAFVYSLTPWQRRKFTGGETIMLREEILSYWQSVQSTKGLERNDVLTSLPARFNRLTVFDPRIPHGVREVRGVHDVRDGRLVIHGWFVQPRPFVEGPLTTRELQGAIDDLGGSLQDLIAEGLDVHGTLSIGFTVNRSGQVEKPRLLSNGLRHPYGNTQIERALIKHITTFLLRARFSNRGKASHVTLPLVFA